MEPQPSKEEILFNWFLADSKEIVQDLKAASAQAEQVLASIQAASGSLEAVVESARVELITAHRELVASIREAQADQRKTIGSLDAQAQRLFDQMQRRTMFIVAPLAVLGGLVGGGFAVWLLHNL